MKSKLLKYNISCIICIMLSYHSAYAQEKTQTFKTYTKLDFRTIHTWRGIVTSYSSTIEPSVGISNKNLAGGIWFANSMDNKYTELDIYLTFTKEKFSFSIFDYYCPASIEEFSKFFNYNKNRTKHTFELVLSFDGSETIPIKMLLGTMVYGDDQFEDNTQRYSTYFQLGYSTKIANHKLDFFLGLSPFKSFYGNTIGIVNAGFTASRKIRVYKNYEIPVVASLISNPLKKALYLNLGFSL